MQWLSSTTSSFTLLTISLGLLLKKLNVSDSLIQNISLLSPLYKAPINELMSQLNMAAINTHQVSVDNYSLTPHEITGFIISGFLLVIVIIIGLILGCKCKNHCNCVRKCALTRCMVKRGGLDGDSVEHPTNGSSDQHTASHEDNMEMTPLSSPTVAETTPRGFILTG